MKILIADDDPAILSLFRCILTTNPKHTIVIAENGDEAVQIIETERNIDLLITDFQMPGKNGVEVLLSARRAQLGARKWLISGAIDDKISKEAADAGADKILWKSSVIKELRTEGII